MNYNYRFTPKSLTFEDEDDYRQGKIDDSLLFYQSIILGSDETKILKDFLRGVKQLDVNIGMSQQGTGTYFVQFIGFSKDKEDSYESNFSYPTHPNMTKVEEPKDDD